MEQLVIVLIIGAVSLIKWLMEKSAEAREQRKTGEAFERREGSVPVDETLRPVNPPPVPNRDDAARRLREALGLPDEEELPPPAPRRPMPPPAPRREPVILFERPVTKFDPRVSIPDLERRLFTPQSEGPLAPAVPPSPPKLRVEPVTKSAAALGVEELLRDREGLRKAILVQEILGPPKGLAF